MTSPPNERILVRVRHAEPVLALGLAAALREQPGFEVLPDGEPAAGTVLVADYATALQLLQPGRRARARVVVMTISDREQEIRRALEAGVHGYVLPGCTMEEVAEAVRVVARGSRYLCQKAAQRMADSLTREALTSREADVLCLLAAGRCNKSIARDLDIAIGTVKAHVKAIMGKLEARSRTQAVAIAAERGLVAQQWAAPTLPARESGGARGWMLRAA